MVFRRDAAFVSTRGERHEDDTGLALVDPSTGIDTLETARLAILKVQLSLTELLCQNDLTDK